MEEEGKRKRIRESWKTESGSWWRRRKRGWGVKEEGRTTGDDGVKRT